MTPVLALLASRIRAEEKWLMAALDQRRVAFDPLDPRRLTFRHESTGPADRPPYRVAFLREISHHRALYAARLLEHAGVPVVNPSQAVAVCGDKVQTTLALRAAGVPTPRGMVALTTEAALAALDEFGYPCVVKPLVGSWGRLVARLDGPEVARAVLEHRAALPNPQQHVFYLQEHIDKPGRDIKSYVAGGEVVCAIYKNAVDDWRTNTAIGGAPTPCPITAELNALAVAAARAVGGGFLGVDILIDQQERMFANEVNHTPEFHGAIDATGVDVAGCIVDWLLAALEELER